MATEVRPLLNHRQPDRIQSGEMSQEEFDALTDAGGGGPRGLLGGIPLVVLAAGAVGVVLVVAVALKGRK